MARFGNTPMPADWRVAERLMATALIVVRHEFAKDLPQVSFSEHDDVVEAFPAECSVRALDEAVLPRRVRRGLDRFDVEVADTIVEAGTKDLVAVMDEEPRLCSVTGEGLNHLAQCPRGRRVGRDIEVDDASSVVTEDHEAIEQPKEGSGHDEEVARSSDIHVVSEEGHPGLTGAAAFRTYPVLVDCGLGHRVTEELEFQMDLGEPHRGFSRDRCLIRRIRSGSTVGRPGFLRDRHLQ